jgi:hypothetical protein
MVEPSDLQVLALSLLETCDSICQRKLKNPIARGFWNRIGKKFCADSIMESPENELKQDLNDIYIKFKGHFEDKQLKDMIDEANLLSDIKVDVINNKEFKRVSKYF